MQVYECGGWKWGSDRSPTYTNNWKIKTNETSIRAVNYFSVGDRDYHKLNEEEVISTNEFYEKQEVTSAIIDEINKYFDKNYPDRWCKGGKR